MSVQKNGDTGVVDDYTELLDDLQKQVEDLYHYRDYYFEGHSLEEAANKNAVIDSKMETIAEKFNAVDENLMPPLQRAQFLYLKGRLYNVGVSYDTRATQNLGKAVKLNPRLVDAWNDLGECYWKNKNMKEARNSLEGALKHERNKVTLRSLSIIIRQDTKNNPTELSEVAQKSLELAKEAVQMDIKDGISWLALGSAHMCKYFRVAQEPKTLKACLSAYKQAETDPIARGQPDLFYNSGIALKYNEQYKEALEHFERSSKLDPSWESPLEERKKLHNYLVKVHELIRTKGKLKAKRVQQMIQSIDKKMLGAYADSDNFKYKPLSELLEGENAGVVVLGKVVGSMLCDNLVPFTFAFVDESGLCFSVTVYNWSRPGVIIGDTVAILVPNMAVHSGEDYNFKSIRVNNPLLLLINGKKIDKNEFAGVQISSTYEIV